MQMKPIDAIQKRLLEEIADLHSVPSGAYNIRANSELAELLEVSVGEPLFDEVGVFADEDGKPLFLGHGRIVASMFSYTLW